MREPRDTLTPETPALPRGRTNDRHFLVALMRLTGHSNKAIAEATGYSEAYVGQMCNSPMFRAQLRDMQRELSQASIADAMDLLRRNAGPAASVLIEIMNNPEADTTNRRLAAGDVMDRIPELSKQTKSTVDNVHRIVLSEESVRKMALAFSPDEVVDAELVPALAAAPEPARLLSLEETIAALRAAEEERIA